MENEGVTKSAILLMSLGEDEAAEVFKHLSPRDVQKISAAMATLKGVSRDDVEGIIGEFCDQAGDGGGLGAASSDYIKNVLKKALGDDKSAALIDRILQGGEIDAEYIRGRGLVRQFGEQSGGQQLRALGQDDGAAGRIGRR